MLYDADNLGVIMKPAAPVCISEVTKSLKENGYAKIENFIPLDLISALWREMHEVGRLVARQLSLELEEFQSPSKTAAKFLILARLDRKFIAIMYDQCKQMPSFLRLSSWEGFQEIYGSIYGTKIVGIGENSYGVRFDLPNEDKFRSHWHQEYAYNPQSPEGLVFWIPLVIMRQDMGSVEILRGSNKAGLVDHEKLKKYSFKNGLYKVGIPDEKLLLDTYEIDTPLSKPGDILLMRFDTIHQSGKNISDYLRVTLQVRYFGFDHSQSTARFWPSKPSEVFGYNVDGKK